MDRPTEATRAVKLLWFSVVLDVVIMLPEVHGYRISGPGWWAWCLVLLAIGLKSMLINKTSSGQNWARILLSISLVIGFFPSYTNMRMILENWAGCDFALRFETAYTLVQVLVHFYVLYLLFLSSGRRWFKAEANAPVISV